MAGDEKFVFDSLQDAESIKKFLQSLVDGFDSGRIILNTSGDEIMLTPGELLNFQVKAKKKNNENKLSLKISWKDPKKEIASTEGSISISS